MGCPFLVTSHLHRKYWIGQRPAAAWSLPFNSVTSPMRRSQSTSTYGSTQEPTGTQMALWSLNTVSRICRVSIPRSLGISLIMMFRANRLPCRRGLLGTATRSWILGTGPMLSTGDVATPEVRVVSENRNFTILGPLNQPHMVLRGSPAPTITDRLHGPFRPLGTGAIQPQILDPDSRFEPAASGSILQCGILYWHRDQ